MVGKLASYNDQNGRRSINSHGISLLSHCFFRFQLDKELCIVYMNTLNWRNRLGYPAQPGLIRPSVHAYRLGIQ